MVLAIGQAAPHPKTTSSQLRYESRWPQLRAQGAAPTASTTLHFASQARMDGPGLCTILHACFKLQRVDSPELLSGALHPDAEGPQHIQASSLQQPSFKKELVSPRTALSSSSEAASSGRPAGRWSCLQPGVASWSRNSVLFSFRGIVAKNRCCWSQALHLSETSSCKTSPLGAPMRPASNGAVQFSACLRCGLGSQASQQPLGKSRKYLLQCSRSANLGRLLARPRSGRSRASKAHAGSNTSAGTKVTTPSSSCQKQLWESRFYLRRGRVDLLFIRSFSYLFLGGSQVLLVAIHTNSISRGSSLNLE